MKLTKRQSEVLACIREHIEATGYPPTRADIAKTLGFKSANAAEEHLKALARKNAIEIIPGTSRGIRIPDLEQPDQGLPIVGRVAAGSPVLAQEHIEEHCTISSDFFHPPAHYLLRVKGTSMKDVGIMDGDLLAVHQCTEAREGQIVIARIGDEVTVKRFHRENHMVYLIAENPEFEPIEVDLRESELSIEGLGVGVIRQGSEP
ncbi:transcriptional repressor LexA [Neptunomonas marina]|uniref:LexA repressor n=2 Tax=Neptunomonas marina TaxID=1815562 RepID=A0A437Q9A8_9GAMM|nr:transcriptional repressor LexA [Neptunomonas marina]RVU30943.1 transcriptional repressor LexA [Neptunomonas marina]